MYQKKLIRLGPLFLSRRETRNERIRQPTVAQSIRLVGHGSVRLLLCKMKKWRRLVVSLCFTFVFYSLVSRINEAVHTAEPTVSTYVSSTDTNRRIKSILIWNSPNRYESGVDFGDGPEAFTANGCSVTECQIIRNRTLSQLTFDQYDAVVFNLMEASLVPLPEEEGLNRFEHQRFVLLSQEAPNTVPIRPEKFINFFNWTMSYRLDSDVLLVYGRVRPINASVQDPHVVRRFIRETHTSTKNYAKSKTKSVVWMATHCSTAGKRETYIDELRKYIDVDVYGGCGDLKCARNEQHWISHPKCYDRLEAQYKFYLSFENSICNDYATEKFFQILAHHLVPIVYGRVNYSRLAPPHSYIDAMQYTPRQLARYLHKLVNNDTLYNEFFWWKEHYTVEAGMEQMVQHGFCDLCQKLHEDTTVKVYDGIKSLWGWQTQCFQMRPWAYNVTQDDDLRVIGWPRSS